MSIRPQPIRPDFYDRINFTYKITSVKRAVVRDTSDVVTEVSFLVFGVYGEDRAEFNSTLSLYIPEEQTDFIAFTELTEDQVKSWAVSEENLDNLKCCVASKIENKRNARAEALNNTPEENLPWNLMPS